MSSERDDGRGFKVLDRRRFDAEGNRRDEGEAEPRPAGPSPAAAPRPAARPSPAEPAPSAAPRRAPEPSGRAQRAESGDDDGLGFSEFVLSIGTNAAQLLGSEDPEWVPSRPDLVTAAQHINILAMLKEKTAGNLLDDEQNLLDSLLYDLQMRYLELARAFAGGR
jgi:hypothetical protein